MSRATEAVLFYRERCHLCEEMAAFLFRHWPAVAAGLQWVDVDRDPVLAARYGTAVPVLAVGDETICFYPPDPVKIERYFGPPAFPV